jgi:hypothetical protein
VSRTARIVAAAALASAITSRSASAAKSPVTSASTGSKNGTEGISTPSAPVTSPSLAPDPRAASRSWLDSSRLDHDAMVATAAELQSRIRTGCVHVGGTLEVRVAVFQTHLPSPDAELNRALSAAARLYNRAAQACIVVDSGTAITLSLHANASEALAEMRAAVLTNSAASLPRTGVRHAAGRNYLACVAKEDGNGTRLRTARTRFSAGQIAFDAAAVRSDFRWRGR